MQEQAEMIAKYYDLPKDTGRSVLLSYYKGSPHFLFHYHPEYEIVFALGTTGKRLVGNQFGRYRQQDLILLPPNLPHTYVAETHLSHEECINVVLHFTKRSIGLELMEKPEMRSVLRLLQSCRQGLCFPEEVLEEVQPIMIEMKEMIEFDFFLSSLRVLYILAHHQAKATALVSNDYCSVLDREDQLLFSQVISYIHKNSKEKIYLDDVATQTDMSVSAFSRFFRRMTGKTFTQYLNEWRIRRACIFLEEFEESIITIAITVGYPNLSHFNRQFLRLMGQTPKEYRSSHRAISDLEY